MFSFFPPDYTVGSGFAPDHAIADFLLWLAGLPAFQPAYRRSGIGSACGPHPAPKDIDLGNIIAYQKILFTIAQI
jgi:hypothetical protein